MAGFYEYFKENMEGLGLTAPPASLFGTQQLAVATLTAILANIDKFGTRVTVMEIAGAATKLEKLAVVGAVGASFYAGAVIGSLAVATGRTISGGTSLSDVIGEVSKWKYKREWLPSLISRMPGVYDEKIADRKYYKNYTFIG